MKLIIQVIFLLLGAPCSAKFEGDCKSTCQRLRPKVLNDVSSSVCKKAANVAPIPKLFQACIEGRKKAFDQCVSMCVIGAQASDFDSFEGCKKVMKKGNARPKTTQWCRKGFDEILSTLEVSIKQQSIPSKHSLIESEKVASNDDVDTDFSEYEASEGDEETIVEQELVPKEADSNEQIQQDVLISTEAHHDRRSDNAAMSDKDDDLYSLDEM